MTFRRKLLCLFGAPIVLAVVLGGLWKMEIIKSLRWLGILCLVCVVIVLVGFILVLAFSRKNPHSEDIMDKAQSIEMKKHNSK